jgi:hypothetical protein
MPRGARLDAEGALHHVMVRGRNIISYVAVCMYGMSLKTVSELLRISKQSVLRGIGIGEERIKEEGFEIKGLIS